MENIQREEEEVFIKESITKTLRRYAVKVDQNGRTISRELLVEVKFFNKSRTSERIILFSNSVLLKKIRLLVQNHGNHQIRKFVVQLLKLLNLRKLLEKNQQNQIHQNERQKVCKSFNHHDSNQVLNIVTLLDCKQYSLDKWSVKLQVVKSVNTVLRCQQLPGTTISDVSCGSDR